METIATKIMLLRKQHGMSQADLAKKLNVSNKLISKWETGTSIPATEYLPKLCKVFDIGIAELFEEASIKKQTVKRTNLKLIAIIGCCIIMLSIFIPTLHLAILPSILKEQFVQDIDKHIERNFKADKFDVTTVIKIDDVPTKINQYGYISQNGEIEYIEHVDDEVAIVIKDGVKYADNRREPFDDAQITDLFDLYDLDSNNETNLSYFVENCSFVDYIYKTFNGYYFELNKGVVNRFISNELGSDMRVTSKIKCRADFKNKKLRKISMTFKAKQGSVPISVDVTETFNLSKQRKKVSHIDNIDSIEWKNLTHISLDDYIDDINVSTITYTPSHLYESTNYFIRYTSSYIYLYNRELELVNKVEFASNSFPSSYFNVVKDYIYCKSYSSYNVLNLNTLQWENISLKYDIVDISSSQTIYYCIEEDNVSISRNIKTGYADRFMGSYRGHDDNNGVYTYIEEKTNGYEVGLYRYYNDTNIFTGGTYTFIGTDVGLYPFEYKYNEYLIDGGKIFNTKLNQAKKVTYNFDDYYIINNIDEIFFTNYTQYTTITNFSNLNHPPIIITNNFSHIVANAEFYFLLDSANDKIYKVSKRFINKIACW